MAIPTDLIEQLAEKYSRYGNAEIILDTLGQVQESLSSAEAARADGSRHSAQQVARANMFFAESLMHEQRAANLVSLLELLLK